MSLSPEKRLLLACGRAKLPEKNLEEIRQNVACEDIDWDKLTATSFTHGIAPLVYHNLQRSAALGSVSPSSTRALRRAYYDNAARNAFLYCELRDVLTAFKERRAEAIVLKGAALAATAYPHPALRPMGDIDVLVRKEQLARVESALSRLGFSFEASAQSKDSYLDNHYHWVFAKPSAVAIEVHWHIQRPGGPFRIDIDGLWKRAQPTVLAGVEALTLSPEDLLLHLCQHMHKHNLVGGIRPLCDIAHVVEYYKDAIDWRKSIAGCFDWGAAPCAYVILSLAKQLLEAPIPNRSLERLKPAAFDRAVLDWAKDRLLDCEGSTVSSNVVQLFCEGGRVRDRAAALLRALSPAAAAASDGAARVSHRIPLAHYSRRVGYLLARYGPLLYQLFAGDDPTRLALKKQHNQLQLTKWLSESCGQPVIPT